MAFITVEDMLGSVEVLIFPKLYEEYRNILNEDEKVLIQGRVSIGDDPEGKLVMDSMMTFAEVPKELWLQFRDKADYERHFNEVRRALSDFDGHDTLVIYLSATKQYKKLDSSFDLLACPEAVSAAGAVIGAENVQVLPKKYSGMNCHYVRINGQMYEPKDGFPTDEQVSKIEEILKKYTMKHTTKPFADDGLYGFEKLYMVFSFTDERGYITDSRGINIDKDMTASTRVRPFLDSLAVIDDGETLYKEVMEVLGLKP